MTLDDFTRILAIADELLDLAMNKTNGLTTDERVALESAADEINAVALAHVDDPDD